MSSTISGFPPLGTHVLLALLLVGVGLFVGARLASDPRVPLVQVVRWWIGRVAEPVLRARRLVRRAAVIFLNNAGVMTAFLALGVWTPLAVAGTFLLGVHLGIGFRLLGERVAEPSQDASAEEPKWGFSMALGLMLNLLEPPAIVLTLALGLAWRSLPLSAAEVWGIHVAVALPLLMLAAVGEGLWMGVMRIRIRDPAVDPPRGPSEKQPHED